MEMISALTLIFAIVGQVDPLEPPEKPIKFDDEPAQVAKETIASFGASASNDARLNDVFFLDALHGAAVGDGGAIWRTDDGGTNWRRQISPTNHTLSSVAFRDEKNGLAAGGFVTPYSRKNHGVVLFTLDGGQTWRERPNLNLPLLRSARFFSGLNGWAVGASSFMFPSGVFFTADGGRSWTPAASGDLTCWSDGDFISAAEGALVDGRGAAAVVRRKGIVPSKTDLGDWRGIAKVRLSPSGFGAAVGDGGLVMTTEDGGVTWRSQSGDATLGKSRGFDFSALAVRGERIWIAGSPGTRVFLSEDGGKSWATHATGATATIRSFFFLDDRQGWAVGDWGTILATSDGGRTWTVQRYGAKRVAALAVFAEANDVPWEALAKIAAQDGYICEIRVFHSEKITTPTDDAAAADDRLREAAFAVGANDGVFERRFPIRAKVLQLTEADYKSVWDSLYAGQGERELESRLVEEIRRLRPEIILAPPADGRGQTPLNRVLGRVTLKAVGEAADAASFPEQIAEMGLTPWQTQRIFSADESGGRGGVDVFSSQTIPRWNATLADAANMARAFVGEKREEAAATVAFRTTFDLATDRAARKRFFAEAPAGSNDYPRRAAQGFGAGRGGGDFEGARRRNALAILERLGKTDGSVGEKLAKIESLSKDLTADDAVRSLARYATAATVEGRWSDAADYRRSLVKRFPRHPLALETYTWLMRYYVSSEIALKERTASETAEREAPVGATPMKKEEERLRRAVDLETEIEKNAPELILDSAARLPLASAYRRLGEKSLAEKVYAALARSGGCDAVRTCAMGERHLAGEEGDSLKPTLLCLRAKEKPNLDGKLDDEIWSRTTPVPLIDSESAGESISCAALAYDDDYLYIAISCRRVADVEYERTVGARTRDADLSAHDRMDVSLDVDRDYATFFNLTVDHRGWTADRLNEDATWNPQWFVAASDDGEAWTVEAAIPFSQLSAEKIKSGDVWGLGLQRTVPGKSFHSWTAPATPEVRPAGFGYLRFE